MLYRRFGRTELNMPVFSCGGMRYQHANKDVPLEEIPDEAQRKLESIIRRSVEVGINHIETARGYGSSERQLGRILPTFPRDEIIVQTKITPYDDPGQFRARVEESLERLNLDYVDLLGLHGINEEETLDQAVRKGGCLEMARRLQSEGLVRHVGFSTHGPTEIILEAINTETGGGFDYVNLHWYYILNKNWPAVLAARARDMGVFLISPTDKGGMLQKPSGKLLELTRPLHPIVFNDLYCLSKPEVHTLSLGAGEVTDFDLHLEAVSLHERSGELLPPILGRLEKAMADAVGADYARDFAKGLPRWQDVPGEINIETILWLHNLARAYDMVEYGRMRYNLMGNAGHWFPGRKAETVNDAELLPLLKDSPFRGEIPQLLRDAHEMLKGEEVKRLTES